jgi:hypothetical protein
MSKTHFPYVRLFSMKLIKRNVLSTFSNLYICQPLALLLKEENKINKVFG